MSFLGKKIRLKGISQSGKNKIRKNGESWVVFAETDRILFNKDELGLWLFVSPEGKGHDHGAAQWIHGTMDINFTIILPE